MTTIACRHVVRMPEHVWHAWARVIGTWPGAGTLPRIDVIPKGTARGQGDRLGWYDIDRHAIVVLDDGDTDETLHTLIHELAHAWAPAERLHHGPGWQRTLCELISWFFATELTRERVLESVPQLRAEHPTMTRGKAALTAFDIALSFAILKHRPTIKITTTEEGRELLVTVGRVVHRVVQPKES